MIFNKILLQWYSLHKRNLPWRETKDPYFIWLSEIILQQTRVDQGMSYYLRFINVFPTISSLASAKEDKVLKLWQGLGYYSRARNLHYSAKYIMRFHNGVFPTSHDDILSLKGVGSYTAAAISSFAFGLPYAVVDGNVIRVLSRLFGIEEPFDTSYGRKKYQELAQSLLDKDRPAENNQAIMEFGALQCTFRSPECAFCPVANHCIAYNTNSIDKFPMRAKKIIPLKRFIHYLVIKHNDCIIIGKMKSGVWKGLYDLPFIESLGRDSDDEIMLSDQWSSLFSETGYQIDSISKEVVHKLTHQHIYAKFWVINISAYLHLEGYIYVKKLDMKDYPVSRLIDKFLKENNMI